MTSKKRFCNGKYRLELRERDHGPAHVHFSGEEHDVLIFLDTLESAGAWPRGLKDEVLRWIEENREKLMEEWKKWHP